MTEASAVPNEVSHTVPHWPLCKISTLPSHGHAPPVNLTGVGTMENETFNMLR